LSYAMESTYYSRLVVQGTSRGGTVWASSLWADAIGLRPTSRKTWATFVTFEYTKFRANTSYSTFNSYKLAILGPMCKISL